MAAYNVVVETRMDERNGSEDTNACALVLSGGPAILRDSGFTAYGITREKAFTRMMERVCERYPHHKFSFSHKKS